MLINRCLTDGEDPLENKSDPFPVGDFTPLGDLLHLFLCDFGGDFLARLIGAGVGLVVEIGDTSSGKVSRLEGYL